MTEKLENGLKSAVRPFIVSRFERVDPLTDFCTPALDILVCWEQGEIEKE